MAMIDYGALLRVKEKGSQKWNFINKDCDLFMQHSDTGYICKHAVQDGQSIDIHGNYFVYAGDEELLFVFYKQCVKVISHGQVIHSIWGSPFLSETYIINQETTLKLEHIDRTLYTNPYETQSWSEYVKEHWKDADGTEPLSDLENGYREYKKFRRHIKRLSHVNKKRGWYRYRTNRYLASWQHNGKEYQVIFGYGIDPQRKVWDRIKNKAYDFSDVERKLIDNWFEIDKEEL